MQLLSLTPRLGLGTDSGLGCPWGVCDSDVRFQVIGLVFLVKGITCCHQPHAFFSCTFRCVFEPSLAPRERERRRAKESLCVCVYLDRPC